MQESDIRNVLHDIKAAVEFLHKQKVTHRDLKPENIVLQEMPNSKVCFLCVNNVSYFFSNLYNHNCTPYII